MGTERWPWYGVLRQKGLGYSTVFLSLRSHVHNEGHEVRGGHGDLVDCS